MTTKKHAPLNVVDETGWTCFDHPSSTGIFYPTLRVDVLCARDTPSLDIASPKVTLVAASFVTLLHNYPLMTNRQ